MTSWRQAFVGAGANLGDRLATLDAALAQLRETPGIGTVASSSVFETDPVGVTDQPSFLNLVAGLETSLAPEELLTVLQRIEQAFGRVRTQRWGPRTLDLDLLAFEGETRATPTLQLPHPRMFERNFVLAPLRDLLDRPAYRAQALATSLRKRIEETAPPTDQAVRIFERRCDHTKRVSKRDRGRFDASRSGKTRRSKSRPRGPIRS